MMKKSSIKKIIIACCTYKRPQKLERLLKSLTELTYPRNIIVEILIVDNDKEKSAENIFKKYTDKLQIRYVVEENKGLSNVRNKALTTAIKFGASHLAFIDDDEIADTNWLVNHIEFYNKFEDVYISSGPTYKKFEGEYPDYIVNNRIFHIYTKKVLGAAKKTCASGNVFFPLNIIQENNIYFSEDFNELGGEDTDFFLRLNKAGFKIGWNLNAVNHEIVDHERANLKWILKRAYHNGYSVALAKFLQNKNPLKRLLYVLEKIITLLFNIIGLPFSICRGLTCFVNYLTIIYKNFGKLTGAINKFYGEQ